MGAGLTVQRVTCMCMGAGLAVRRVLGSAENPLHGQAPEKFNLLLYRFQEYDFKHPTLQTAKTYLKRSLFED